MLAVSAADPCKVTTLRQCRYIVDSLLEELFSCHELASDVEVDVFCDCRHGNSYSNGGDPDSEILHYSVRHTSQAVVQHVHWTVCQVLHHWCHCPCRRRTGRSTARCHAGTCLLRQGQSFTHLALYSLAELVPYGHQCCFAWIVV